MVPFRVTVSRGRLRSLLLRAAVQFATIVFLFEWVIRLFLTVSNKFFFNELPILIKVGLILGFCTTATSDGF